MADGVTSAHDELRYLTVRRAIEERIADGTYRVGTAIPSENELAMEFDTTRFTVRTALESLVESGAIRRAQGKGAFVSPAWIGSGLDDTDGFRETVRSAHAEPSVRILSCAKREAGGHYASLFGLEPADILFSVRRLNMVDGIPVSIERALMPYALFPGVDEIDLSMFSLYETYKMYGHAVELAQERIDIEALSARDAKLLGVGAGSPALLLECLSYDGDGTVVEYARAWNRGDMGGYLYRF